MNTPEVTETLQTDMTKLEQWANHQQMTFKSQKCKVMFIGNNNTKHAYSIQEGKAVEWKQWILYSILVCISIQD